MEILFFYLILCILVGVWANQKPALGFLGGFFLSLLLSPLIGAIITGVSKDKHAAPPFIVPNNNRADEVHKASLLYKDGHISKDEFDRIKLANGFSIEAKERTEEEKKESAAMWQVIYEQNRKREQTNQYILIAVAVALFIAIVIYANT